MKLAGILLLVFSLATSSCQHGKKISKEVEFHLNILDSAAKESKSDTIVCCIPSINYLQKQSSIVATGFISHFGPLAYTKGDLRNWREWYLVTFKKRK